MVKKMKRKKNVLLKELFVEIKKSFPRFLSILIMVFLGTAFFSGVGATGPDMQKSADAFYDETSFMDIRIFGDLGITEADVDKVREIDGITAAEGRYEVDVFWKTEGESRPIKLMSYSEQMDSPLVTEGRMPEKTGECIIDEGLSEKYNCKIGDSITLKSGTEDKLKDIVGCKTYEIVGIGDSPYYLSHERGTTTIGNGELEGFLIIPAEDFTLDVFTQITAKVEGTADLLCYDDAYEQTVDPVIEKIEAIEEERCEIRYDEIVTEAEEELAEGEQEIADAKKKIADAEEEIADAKEEIADGKKKVSDGKKEIKKNEKKLKDSEKELDKAQKEIADGKKEIKKAKKELNKAKKQLSKSKEELDAAKKEIESSKEGLAYMPPEYAASVSTQIEQAEKQYEEGLKQYKAGLKGVKKNEKALLKNEKELLKAEEEIKEGKKELKAGKKELKKAKKELEKAEKELQDGEKELLEAEEEFKEKSAEAEEEIRDGEKKLKDAQKELDDLEVPEWYVLGRDSVQTYVEYEQDAQRIAAIGKVVPVLFFLVAALVCLTTMTRMIDEDRTQIGVLKALGYSKNTISMKYLLYALISTFFGTVVGVLFGQKAFPYIIMTAYGLLYENVPNYLLPIHTSFTIISFVIAVGCILFSAYSACAKTLKEVPANLMRPVAPKAGKKILLERIPILWHHLNFSRKAAIRNLVRYKKRLLMTVFGIGGCMALLITGYGIRDSIMAIGDLQYGRVQLYDGTIQMDEDATKREKKQLIDALDADERITEYTYVREAAVDVSSKTGEESAVFLVPEDPDVFETFVNFSERKTDTVHQLSEDGIIIDEKLSMLLDVKVGDIVSIKEGDDKPFEVKVSAIVQNYFNHYVYMSPALYEQIYEEIPEYHSIYTSQTKRDEDMEKGIRNEYMELDAVTGISFVSASNETISTMLKSMDTLIYVIIIAAGMLAFVVLYNLNNINIGERKRELATLKVLGFYDLEVSNYVFRENVIITVLGIIVGIVLGILLHRFVVLTVETDILFFGREITKLSFALSILFTLLFSLIVNGFMHFKMKKIDMIESLKSVE